MESYEIIMKNKNIINNLRKIAPKHCDQCGFRYNMSDFKVIRVVEESALIHLSCPSCGNTYVINAYINNSGMGSKRIPLVIDLKDANEVEKFAEQPSVSKDDAIDLYNFLSDSKSSKFKGQTKIRASRILKPNQTSMP